MRALTSLLLAFSLLLPFQRVHAAGAVVGTGTASTASATSLTVSINPGTNSNVSIILSCSGDGGVTMSSATYDGNAMTLIGTAGNPAIGDRSVTSWIYAAGNTTAGAKDATCNFSSGQASAGAVAISGTSGTTSSVQTETPTGNFSLVVSSATGDIVVDALVTGSRTITIGGGQTEIYNLQPVDSRGFGSYEAGAASVTMSETQSSSVGAGGAAHIAFNVPAGTQGGVAPPSFQLWPFSLF